MSNKSGFTIIESLVAIAILISAIIGATMAVQTGLASYTFSKDQIIAFYLAQEGFEQIRNIRDANQINNRPWLTGLAAVSSDPCYYGQACLVDPTATAIAVRCASPGNCPFLHQDSVNGFYGYTSAWPTTRFRREITLSSVNSEEIAVTVTVNWTKGSATRQFKARENLFNWQ
jgi:type II secretory pathway pseudopilin PulG